MELEELDLSRAGVLPDKYAIVTGSKESDNVCKGMIILMDHRI